MLETILEIVPVFLAGAAAAWLILWTVGQGRPQPSVQAGRRVAWVAFGTIALLSAAGLGFGYYLYHGLMQDLAVIEPLEAHWAHATPAMPVVVIPYPTTEGTRHLLIKSVLPGSPFAGHYRKGDAIVSIDGAPIQSIQEVVRAFDQLFVLPSQPAELTLRREGRTRRVSVPALTDTQ